MLKFLKAGTAHLLPFTSAHLEVLERWPSAAAMVIGCSTLAYWLARTITPALAFCATAVLMLTTGVSRYGQEARPYAFVMMCAVLTSVLWWKLLSDRRIRWIAGYAVAIAVMVALHALAATLIAAHLVAAAILRRDDAMSMTSRTRVFRTLAGGITGLVMASPLTIAALSHGTGAASGGHGLAEAASMFVPLFNSLAWFNNPAVASLQVTVLLIIVLAALPITAIVGQWFSKPYANITRLATCWALVPLAALFPAVQVRPSLTATRYFLFVVPGWAILTGLGLITVASCAGQMAELVPRLGNPARRAIAVQFVVVVALLGAGAIVQRPSLLAVRSTQGHGEDFRVLLRLAESPTYRELPIEIFPPPEAIQLSAYLAAAESRLINVRQPQFGPVIWTKRLRGATVTKSLRNAPAVIVMVRAGKPVRAPSGWKYCSVTYVNKTDPKWSLFVIRQGQVQDPGAPDCSEPRR